MGHKVNPRAYRIGTVYQPTSRWFTKKQDFPSKLKEDLEIREIIKTKFKNSGVARVDIERSSGAVTITMNTSKPGVIIGRGGSGIDELKKLIKKNVYGSTKVVINISIQEVAKPDLSAELIVQNIAEQLEKRIPFRRAMKRAIESSRRAGAEGVRITVSGRLNGAEIARTETLTEGSLPLHTLRANIDYSRGVARTIFGAIGIKVWIYTGDVFEGDEKKEEAAPEKRRPTFRRAPARGITSKEGTPVAPRPRRKANVPTQPVKAE